MKILKKLTKPTLLLHSCCGPCSSACLERLVADYSVTILYYNPCIHPEEEYLKRKQTQIELIEKFNKERNENVKFLETDWDSFKFFELTKGLEKEIEGGARCAVCFKQRLQKTASTAKEKGFDFFTTTLTVSPHKNAELINEIGNELEKEYSVKYLQSNFKKQNGYLRSIQLSKEYNLYRQNYCGCVFSFRGDR